MLDGPRWLASWLTRDTLEVLVTVYLLMLVLAFGVGLVAVLALHLLT